jgi:quercetin dioxygenase-like cupin family protein
MKVIKVAKVAKESHPGPMFTGLVTMQPIVDSELSKEFRIAQVNFGRGVRNKFHSHTFEQVLIVTEGKGIVATEKEQIAVVPGDIIFIPSGEKHWHGAAKGETFSHLFIMSQGSKTIQLED